MHLDIWIASVKVVKVEKKRSRGCSDALLVVEILHLVVPFDFSLAPLQTFPDETRGIAVAGQKAAVSRIAARRYPRRTSRRLRKSCSMHPKRRTLTMRAQLLRRGDVSGLYLTKLTCIVQQRSMARQRCEQAAAQPRLRLLPSATLPDHAPLSRAASPYPRPHQHSLRPPHQGMSPQPTTPLRRASQGTVCATCRLQATVVQLWLVGQAVWRRRFPLHHGVNHGERSDGRYQEGSPGEAAQVLFRHQLVQFV